MAQKLLVESILDKSNYTKSKDKFVDNAVSSLRTMWDKAFDDAVGCVEVNDFTDEQTSKAFIHNLIGATPYIRSRRAKPK